MEAKHGQKRNILKFLVTENFTEYDNENFVPSHLFSHYLKVHFNFYEENVKILKTKRP